MQHALIGQKVEVDVFGLGAPGGAKFNAGAVPGTVVSVAPGSITVKLDIAPHGHEVTVGPVRVTQVI